MLENFCHLYHKYSRMKSNFSSPESLLELDSLLDTERLLDMRVDGHFGVMQPFELTMDNFVTAFRYKQMRLASL